MLSSPLAYTNVESIAFYFLNSYLQLLHIYSVDMIIPRSKGTH